MKQSSNKTFSLPHPNLTKTNNCISKTQINANMVTVKKIPFYPVPITREKASPPKF